jgi:hypothetical protein
VSGPVREMLPYSSPALCSTPSVTDASLRRRSLTAVTACCYLAKCGSFDSDANVLTSVELVRPQLHLVLLTWSK